MELKMKNAVPLNTIASTYNVSIHELLLLVGSMKLDLIYVEGIVFVNASDFEVLNTVEDIFIYTFAAKHHLASNTEA
jgi:hypothetical protein